VVNLFLNSITLSLHYLLFVTYYGLGYSLVLMLSEDMSSAMLFCIMRQSTNIYAVIGVLEFF
jgi:hypothetical protein